MASASFFLNPYLPSGAVSSLGYMLSLLELGNSLTCWDVCLSPSHSTEARSRAAAALLLCLSPSTALLLVLSSFSPSHFPKHSRSGKTEESWISTVCTWVCLRASPLPGTRHLQRVTILRHVVEVSGRFLPYFRRKSCKSVRLIWVLFQLCEK